jgi:homopolymeric O-antigen transport system ATP-binding protein
MTAAAIRFDDVWKAYPRWVPGSRTLRGVITRRLPALMRFGDQRWVLQAISFEVQRGASVGLVGHNGAGKSTLLRLASGLGRPSRGRIEVPARTASVLSLGDAFDLALTGRENAITAAVIGGMTEAAARRQLPQVLEFAELEGFADAPMRTYSEGMKLRLAFAVVAQLQPDLMLLDEVISVGDVRFQAKCRDRLREMREAGTSLLLASHSLEEIVSECDDAIWLHSGSVRSFGKAADVVAEYRGAMLSTTMTRTPAPTGGDQSHLELRRNRLGSQEITIEEVGMTDLQGSPISELVTGSPLAVSLTMRRHTRSASDPTVTVSVHRVSDGVVCLDSNTEADGVTVDPTEREARVTIVYDRVDLLPGEYMLEVGAYRHDWEYAYDAHLRAYPLRVVGPREGQGVFRAPHRWEVAR